MNAKYRTCKFADIKFADTPSSILYCFCCKQTGRLEDSSDELCEGCRSYRKETEKEIKK